jgi:hypothetical protein
MQLKTKTFIVIILSLIVALGMIGCETKLPEEQQIKKDLVGKKIYLDGNAFYGGTTYVIKEDELKKVEILKRQTNKKEKQDIIFIGVEINDGYITYHGVLKLEYNRYDDKGWVLDNIDREGEKLEIKANSALSEEEILKPLFETPILLANSGEWQVRENEVESVEILERDTSLDEMLDKVKLHVVCKNGSEMVRFTDTFVYTYKENKNGNGYQWVYTGLENPKDIYNSKINIVEDYEIALYDGVNENIIKNILLPKKTYQKKLYNIIKLSNKAKEFSYTWNLRDISEIKEMVIINQDTNLEKKKDHVEVELTLEKDSIRAKGNLIMDLWYGDSLQGIGWHISDYKVNENKPFNIEYIIKPTLTEEKIKKELLGKKFVYRSGFFTRTRSWTIESGEVRKFQLLGYRPYYSEDNIIDANTIAYDIELVLQGSEKAIKGYASMIYELSEDGKYNFVDIKRIDNFEVISQEELDELTNYEGTEFEQSLNVIENNELEKIKFDKLIPSSTLEPNTDKYKVDNLLDDNNKTAWVEGKKGDGIGESVTFKANKPFLVKEIRINNGYKKSKNLYTANNRVKNIKITFSDGSELIKELKDDYSKIETFKLEIEKEVEWIKFTILDVYKGSKYDDTCISGIEVLGKILNEN